MKDYYEDPDRMAVIFSLQLEDGNKSKAAISAEALQDHFGADENLTPAFINNRGRIEAIARELAHRDRMVDGEILIKTMDIR